MKLCIIVAIHLAFLQQMCGVNVVVLYGGQIIDDAVNNPDWSKWMQVFLIGTQFIACLCTSYILKKVGRKILLQLGTGVSFIVLTIIGIAFVAMHNNTTGQQVLVITSLYVFMISFGFTLGPVVWLYIPEIVPADIVPYTTLSNWTGASITIILFPILADLIGQQGYLFFIFSVWCLLSVGFNQKYVVETMGKT
jgi:MFS family permease